MARFKRQDVANHEERRPPSLLAIVAWGTAAAFTLGLLLAQTFAWMLAEGASRGNVSWLQPWTHINSGQIYDVMRSDVAAVALVGAGGAALIAYRRQAVAEGQHNLEKSRHVLEQRGDIRERYTTGADQLGHASAAVRLAGVYTLAQVADDWGERGDADQQQVCIDVLCAYLRMPLSTSASEQEKQVRRTVIRVIGDHVRASKGRVSWSHATFDLSGAELDEVNFDRARFDGHLSMVGAVFKRYASFEGATFSRDTLFTNSRFEVELADFERCTFMGRVVFAHADFGTSQLNFQHAAFLNAKVLFDGVKARKAVVMFSEMTLRRSSLTFKDAHIPDPGSADTRAALFIAECEADGDSSLDFSELGEGGPAWPGSQPPWLLLPAESVVDQDAEPNAEASSPNVAWTKESLIDRGPKTEDEETAE